MEANYSVTARPDLSMAQNRAHNIDFNFNANEYLLSRPQDFWVYIFSISERTYDIYRPPVIKQMVLIGKAPKAKYALCARFPHPMNVPDASVDSSELGIKQMDARRFCQDICNPDNIGFDQNSVINAPTSIGNDLNAKGVFWVTEKECTFAEEDTKHLYPIPPTRLLEDAKRRMEKYYRSLTEKATTVHSSKPSDLADFLTPEHFAAAEYLEENFGMRFPWHQKMSRLEECALCGEHTKVGVAFHRMEDGGICVRDWAKAVKAGARTRAQAYEATDDEQFAPKHPKAPVAPATPSIPTEK